MWICESKAQDKLTPVCHYAGETKRIFKIADIFRLHSKLFLYTQSFAIHALCKFYPHLFGTKRIVIYYSVQCLITRCKKKDLRRYHSNSDVFMTNDYRMDWRLWYNDVFTWWTGQIDNNPFLLVFLCKTGKDGTDWVCKNWQICFTKNGESPFNTSLEYKRTNCVHQKKLHSFFILSQLS